jgi:hypothetical protein
MKRKKFPTATVIAASLLAAAAILSVSAAPVLAAAPVPDTSWYDNNSAAMSFVISKDVQLAGLAKLVNATSATSNDFNGRTITIDRNINLSAFDNWTPIGNASNPFKGRFNGNGKIISNLFITSGAGPAGLFGKISTGATVQNLNLRGINIKGGTGDTGSIAGINDGSIISCTVAGIINGVNAVSAGGIAGNNENGGAIEGCTVVSGSSITGTSGKTGALAGLNSQTNNKINKNSVHKDVRVNNALVSQNNLVGSGAAPTNTSIKSQWTHGKNSSGCDAGFGFAGFAALVGTGLICRRKEQ